jgi:mitogen-activated protein kinase 1/2
MIPKQTCASSSLWFENICIDFMASEYIPIEPVGQGAYGIVFSALKIGGVSGEPESVAIKKLSGILDGGTSVTRLFREVVCMREMQHPNILKLTDILYNNQDVYIVSDLMETDLGSVLKTEQVLSIEQMLVLFYQLVDGISYIHECGIIHRDLKPRNILLSSFCDVKICDFGLARLDDSSKQPFTEYVCTRWYRAPEILFPACKYTNKIDIFSLGCIMAEVVGKKPLLPGSNSINQYELILKRFGKLKDADISMIPNAMIRKYLHKLNSISSVNGDFEEYLESESSPWSENVASLVRSLVCFDPSARPQARDVMQTRLFDTFKPHREWEAQPTLRYILSKDSDNRIAREFLESVRIAHVN